MEGDKLEGRVMHPDGRGLTRRSGDASCVYCVCSNIPTCVGSRNGVVVLWSKFILIEVILPLNHTPQFMPFLCNKFIYFIILCCKQNADPLSSARKYYATLNNIKLVCEARWSIQAKDIRILQSDFVTYWSIQCPAIHMDCMLSCNPFHCHVCNV
jgi:hypothetical protein